MKTKLIIVVAWLGLVVWYGYETISVYKENMEVQVQRLKAIGQE